MDRGAHGCRSHEKEARRCMEWLRHIGPYGLCFAVRIAGTCSSVLYVWLSGHWDSTLPAALPSTAACVVLKLRPGQGPPRTCNGFVKDHCPLDLPLPVTLPGLPPPRSLLACESLNLLLPVYPCCVPGPLPCAKDFTPALTDPSILAVCSDCCPVLRT